MLPVCDRGGQIHLGRNVCCMPGNGIGMLDAYGFNEFWKRGKPLIVVTLAKTLSGRWKKAVPSQRTKLRPLLQGQSQILGWFPKPCVGCHFRLSLLETCLQMAWKWASSIAGLSKPQGPTKDWTRVFRMTTHLVAQRRGIVFLQPASLSAIHRLPKGFQVQIPRIPDPLTHLKFIF